MGRNKVAVDQAPPPAYKSSDSTASQSTSVEKSADVEEYDSVPERGQWGNQIEFILACVGYAVGLGNVWRFPYLCYENGGGAFLVPYIISLFLAGLPIFYLELSIGQFSSLGANKLYEKLAPILTGVGWAMVTVSFTVSIYYNVIIAWVLLYFVISLRGTMMWDTCRGDWNTASCVSDRETTRCYEDNHVNSTQDMIYFNKTCYFGDDYSEGKSLNRSYFEQPAHSRRPPAEEFFNNWVYDLKDQDEQGFENLGGFQWPLVGALTAAWIIVFLCLMKGVQSTGKVVYFTATFPYFVLVILLVRGVTLEGASSGILFYITPQLDKLTDVKVWKAAATQIFYSLGPGFGSLLTMASYNRFNNNCYRDALIVAFTNCGTSIFAGFAIFSTMGFMATMTDQPVDAVIKSGPGLAFIAYPEAIVRMPLPTIWAMLFFFMLFTLGLDSQFAMVECVTTAFLDQFTSLRKKKWMVIGTACFIMYLFGLPMCLKGGIFIFTMFDDYTATYCLLVVSLFEFAIIGYLYGMHRYLADLERMLGRKWSQVWQRVLGPQGYYWRAMWMVVSPLLLTAILIISLVQPSRSQYNGYVFTDAPTIAGYVLAFIPVCMIPIFAIQKLISYMIRKDDAKQISDLWRASEKWCPASEREARRRNKRQIEMSNTAGTYGKGGADNDAYDRY